MKSGTLNKWVENQKSVKEKIEENNIKEAKEDAKVIGARAAAWINGVKLEDIEPPKEKLKPKVEEKPKDPPKPTETKTSSKLQETIKKSEKELALRAKIREKKEIESSLEAKI